jgi:hypothetical protein
VNPLRTSLRSHPAQWGGGTVFTNACAGCASQQAPFSRAQLYLCTLCPLPLALPPPHARPHLQTLASYVWFFNASGLAGVAKEVHISLNAEGHMPAGTLATISRLVHTFLPAAVISVYDSNEFEFRAILQAWKYGVRQMASGHPDDIVLYCHNKGATHGTTFVPFLSSTAANWRFFRRLFASGMTCTLLLSLKWGRRDG